MNSIAPQTTSRSHKEQTSTIGWALSSVARVSAAGLMFAMVAAGSATVAQAAKLNFTADLRGQGEVPPVKSPGKGHVTATLDTDTNTLSWSVTHSALSAKPIGAHFHGPVSYVGNTSEENAPIQVGTPGDLSSPFKGSTTITATQAKDLKDGRWYFNLHTPAHPDGEIRGQVIRTN